MRLQDLQWWKSPKALPHHSSHHEAKQGIYGNLIRGKDSEAVIKHKSFSAKFSQTLLTPIIHLESAFDCHSLCPWGLGSSSTWIRLWAVTSSTLQHTGYCQKQLLLCKVIRFNWILKSRVIISGDIKCNPPSLECARLVQDTLKQFSREPLRVWDEYFSCDYSITATNARIWHQLHCWAVPVLNQNITFKPMKTFLT